MCVCAGGYVMLCYLFYFVWFALLLFFKPCLAELNFGGKKKKFEKDWAMGKLLSYILC